MARVTFIPPFMNYHGKIKKPDQDTGLVAFSSERAGNVARQWVLPTNPKSAQQVFQRGVFSSAAAAYKAVTVAEAAAWIALGDLISKSNILGIGYKLTGIATYVLVNTLRQINAQATTDIAPTFADIPIPITGITSVVWLAGTYTVVLDCAGIADGALVFMRATDSIARESRMLRRNELRIPSSTETEAFGIVGTSAVTITGTNDLITLAATEFCGLEFTVMSADYLPRAPWFIPQRLIA